MKSVGSINRTDELVLYLSLYSDKYAESEFLKIELVRMMTMNRREIPKSRSTMWRTQTKKKAKVGELLC